MASSNFSKISCKTCKRLVSRLNFHRHVKSFHLLCPQCLTLESRAKHPCFGSRLLSRSSFFSRAEGDDTSPGPLTSNIYIPMEARADCVGAMTAVLAGRALMDTDLYTPAFFLLAHAQRSCLACTAGRTASPVFHDLHTCRLNSTLIIDSLAPLVCHLFNIHHTAELNHFFCTFLQENTLP